MHDLWSGPGYSGSGDFWTERNAGFALLAYEWAAMVSDDRADQFVAWAQENVDAVLPMMDNSANGWEPDARCFAHHAADHDEGYGYVGCSPWMSAILADGLDGRIYSDAFYEPYLGWYPELPEGVYLGLLWLAAVAAVAMSIGLLTRLATTTTFAIVAYNLFLSTTHFHNNRAYLVIVLGLLAVAP